MKILIVGGGIMGLSCAWRLAAAGAQVELFEARACGEGATLAALGRALAGESLADGPLQRLHRESLWQFESFAAEIAARAEMPLGFLRLGRLELLHSSKAEARAREEAAHANEHWPRFASPGPTMQLIAAADLAAEYPQLAPQTNAALLCRATAQVHVPQLIAALRMLCIRSGVVLHEQMPIAAFECADSRMTACRTPGNTIHEADAFLLTAGAWSSLPATPIDLQRAAPVRPVKGQGLAIRPAHAVHLPHILKSGSTYLIPWENSDGSSEILVGSTTEPESGYDELPTAQARDSLLEAAAKLVPGLKDAKIMRHWAGLRPQNPTKPHVPHMGPHPRVPNLYVCTGHYKTGIGLAPRVSQLVAKALLSATVPDELMPFMPHGE